MSLLEALVETINANRPGVTNARMVYFAFADSGDSAFLSEIETEELLPLIEEWCQEQRASKGLVH